MRFLAQHPGTTAILTACLLIGLMIPDSWLSFLPTLGDNSAQRIIHVGGVEGIDTLIIEGPGCLETEDSTHLELAKYQPGRGTIVYRCVTP